MQEPSSDVAQAMHRLADEIHALRMEPVSYTHLTLPTTPYV